MQENNNSSSRRGFPLTMENLFALMQQVYYTKGQSENKFLAKTGGVISGDITIQGNIVINGQSYYIDTQRLNVEDYVITLANGNTQTLTSMVGMVVPKYDGTNYGFLGWDADGYAYVGDLTNYDGSSAITIANNSGLQKIGTIDTANTIAPTNGQVYIYDATNHTFKKVSSDSKFYVIKNGALVEMPLTLASFSDDATHRLVTDTEKATWNEKQSALGSDNKLNPNYINGATKETWTFTMSDNTTVTKKVLVFND